MIAMIKPQTRIPINGLRILKQKKIQLKKNTLVLYLETYMQAITIQLMTTIFLNQDLKCQQHCWDTLIKSLRM